jgi:hypothetical protein
VEGVHDPAELEALDVRELCESFDFGRPCSDNARVNRGHVGFRHVLNDKAGCRAPLHHTCHVHERHVQVDHTPAATEFVERVFHDRCRPH